MMKKRGSLQKSKRGFYQKVAGVKAPSGGILSVKVKKATGSLPSYRGSFSVSKNK